MDKKVEQQPAATPASGEQKPAADTAKPAPHVGIAYWSTTGNTKYVAECIGKRLRAQGCEVTLVDVTIAAKIDLSKFDGIDAFGIGCPTFCYQTPRPLQPFLRSLPPTLVKNKPAFVFDTAGGNEGSVLKQMADILEGLGAVIVGALTVYAPGNFIPWSPAKGLVSYWGSDEYEKADKFACELFPRLTNPNLQSVRVKISSTKLGCVVGWSWMHSLADSMVGDIEVDPQACTKCYTCVKMCPSGALSVSPGDKGIVVKDKSKCIGCMRCINLCPNEAMNCKGAKEKHRYVFDKKKVLRQGKNRKAVKPDDEEGKNVAEEKKA